MESDGNQLDHSNSVLCKILFKQNKEILESIAEQIKHIKNDVKSRVIFPCLIKSIEQSRNNDTLESEYLASNAITLLNQCDQFYFQDLDFSNCRISYAMLTRNKIEGVNFENCQ